MFRYTRYWLFILTVLLSCNPFPPAFAAADLQSDPTRTEAFDRLEAKADSSGAIPVIVQLRTGSLPNIDGPWQRRLDPEGTERRFRARERLIDKAQERLDVDMNVASTRFRHLPLMALRADRATLERLRNRSDVLTVTEDRPHRPVLNVSVPRIGGNLAFGQGYTGAGQAVAIIDTGVQTSHPFFSGRVLNSAEACYSGAGFPNPVAGITTLCPKSPARCTDAPAAINTANTACGAGAGVNCSSGSCWHGTHVAGIALGNDSTFRGVAPGASLIPIQVFVIENGSLVAYDSDIIAGLQHVLALSQAGTEIAAVNMSLGGSVYTSTSRCDAESAATKVAVDALRAAGVATVVAAGNDGIKTGIATPGCISTVISVAATDNSDAIASFSNLAPAASVFAPGVGVTAAYPGNALATASGTSMSTPHVAGALAVLRQKAFTLGLDPSVDQLLAALRLSGTPITYGTNAYSTPRIQLNQALGLIQADLPVELIMDSQTAAAGISRVSGVFSSVGSTAAYGGDTLRGTSSNQTNTLRFTPSLASGNYDVSVWWPALTGNSTQATATISHDGGQATATLNQTQNGGRWNFLGNYHFGIGPSPDYLQLTSNAGTAPVTADAVRFRMTSAGAPALSLPSQLLPVGYANAAYSATLKFGGGLLPYTSRLTGTLPAGLTFNAATSTITGTPTAAVSAWPVDVEVQDSIGSVATGRVQLDVFAQSATQTVWVDDLLPGGATPIGSFEEWSWASSNPNSFSGNLVHQSSLVAGSHQHYFDGATQTLAVPAGGTLFTYVYLDPAHPPREIMLKWNDGTSWEHRAFWGENLFNYGTTTGPSAYYIGPLPAAGQWVRLEVPAGAVGLAGATLKGMAFALYDGQVTWDYTGVTAPAPVVTSYAITGSILVSGNPLAGVTIQASTGATCTTTTIAGAFECNVSPGWSGTLTPVLAGYSFSPTQRTYSNVAANQSAQDFAATVLPPQPVVWVDDAAPSGATLYGSAETWSWISTNPSPYSGTRAHVSPLVSGPHQHYFDGATQTLAVPAGGKLFTYVYLDPAHPPREIMLKWSDGTSWEHRAFWGENLLNYGTTTGPSAYYIGPLPATGQWVRLEVPASVVGLGGQTIKGMAFALFDGQAVWDYTGAIQP